MAQRAAGRSRQGRHFESRRRLLKAAAISGIAASAALTVGLAGKRLADTVEAGRSPRLSQSFTYYVGVQQHNAWYKDLAGKPVRVGDFQKGHGALAKWGDLPLLKPCWLLYLDPQAQHSVPDSSGGIRSEHGLRIPAGAQVVHHEGGVFVGFYGGCVHACCIPGWHEAYPSLDIFHCTCHNSRYTPWDLEEGEDEGGRGYIGARCVQLPAQRILPYIPLELVGDRLHGILTDENAGWYRYCGLKKEGR